MHWNLSSHISNKYFVAAKNGLATVASTTTFVVAILILCVAPTVHGYLQNYLPLSPAELARRFPQELIRVPTKSGAQARFGMATIRLEDQGRLNIRGKDNDGRDWSVGHPYLGL